MSICLCNLSADRVLELAAQKKIDLVPASPDPTEFLADYVLAKDALGEIAERLPRPIDLLVGDPMRRRRSLEATCRLWKGPLPRNGVFALDEGIYVSSPEFTLLQQASQLHQANLCQMLGRYLGTWSPKEDELSGQIKRAPLTSFESLNEFLRGIGKAWGKSNLRLAMAYTCEGAASAPETSLQLVLSLSPKLHGLGITQPIMNYEVNLSAEAKELYPHDTIRIDLCWRNKMFGLEYQGRVHGSQLGEDYARWFAAREMGYELWFVAEEQLINAGQIMRIAHQVVKRIDAEVDEYLWPSKDELQDLLDILAGRKHPKPVPYCELRRGAGVKRRSPR